MVIIRSPKIYPKNKVTKAYYDDAKPHLKIIFFFFNRCHFANIIYFEKFIKYMHPNKQKNIKLSQFSEVFLLIMELNTSKTIVDNQYQADKKSFQNCSESDLVGYNDCPTFLFSNTQTKAISSRNKKKLKHRMLDTPRESADLETQSNENIDDSSKVLSNVIEQIDEKINMNLKNLDEKELSFYKKKYQNNLPMISGNNRYLKNISDIFLEDLESNVIKAKIHEWVTKEPTVGSWLVPLAKII